MNIDVKSNGALAAAIIASLKANLESSISNRDLAKEALDRVSSSISAIMKNIEDEGQALFMSALANGIGQIGAAVVSVAGLGLASKGTAEVSEQLKVSDTKLTASEGMLKDVRVASGQAPNPAVGEQPGFNRVEELQISSARTRIQAGQEPKANGVTSQRVIDEAYRREAAVAQDKLVAGEYDDFNSHPEKVKNLAIEGLEFKEDGTGSGDRVKNSLEMEAKKHSETSGKYQSQLSNMMQKYQMLSGVGGQLANGTGQIFGGWQQSVAKKATADQTDHQGYKTIAETSSNDALSTSRDDQGKSNKAIDALIQAEQMLAFQRA